ncbi:metallophosphoesterase [Pseudalkalibacillus sp. SCS-8]|uniref:metallophosphoesterase n=1 Tax=Pseudalkalibacillus nanhaiensis TaxID=3115291 RepID=UPI0032DB48D9
MYVIAFLFFLGIIVALLKAHKNTKDIKLEKVHIKKKQAKPLTGLNVLQISDMHLENISVSPEELYDRLKEEPIDLIALTGDFLDRKRTLKKLPSYLDIFQKLNPKHGIYAVFGNHDYVLKGKHFEQLEKTLQNHGCITLRNEHKQIVMNGVKMNIIGIDDYGTGNSNLTASYDGLKDSDYNLVLTHDPNVVLEMNSTQFDYLLSGHFHNGQIHWPKPYHLVKMGKLARMNMVKGLLYMHDKPFYISEGLGQTGVNIRVGSRPEITIHHIEISKAQSDAIVAS